MTDPTPAQPPATETMIDRRLERLRGYFYEMITARNTEHVIRLAGAAMQAFSDIDEALSHGEALPTDWSHGRDE